MTEASPGDVVFSFCDTYIKAIGIVNGFSQSAPKPTEFGSAGEYWSNEGWYLPVRFSVIDSALRPKDHMEAIKQTLPEKYSPLQANGNGNQGVYLNDRSNDKNICVTANRLLHSPKIQVLIQSINSTAIELLADDRKATRGYVFRELFALSKQAKQERYKIKALELLGKSCGLFKQVDMGAVKAPNDKH
jgi:putative restriction endonuclease